ncbi:MAG: hypothetical protein IK045_02750 [Bacteroidales bacterium]|nr:hypothetical protein [Bacteroidales bacterium]
MKADNLLNWDKAELAGVLAETLCDADDLLEAIPSLDTLDGRERSRLDDYIDSHWVEILSSYNLRELDWWLENKNEEEEYNRWCAEIDIEELEYYEELDLQEAWKYAALMFSFRTNDFAGIISHPLFTKSRN